MAGEWDLREEAGVRVLKVAREVDLEGLKSLEEALAPLLSVPKARLVVDLAGCPRVTSEMLRLFLMVARRLEAQKGGFALASPGDEVQRFLEISGVARLCQVLPSVGEAVAAVRGDDRTEALAKAVLALLSRAEERGGVQA